MSRRRYAILAAAALLLALVIFALTPGREPAFQGRPLSEWIVRANPHLMLTGPTPGGLRRDEVTISVDDKEAADAVRQIGAKALPVLLEWIEHPESPFKQGWRDVLGLLPRQLRSGALKSENRAELAIAAFKLLGPEAAPAAPALARIMRDRTAPQPAREAAMMALAQVGKAGLQPLLDAFCDPHQPGRRLAAFAVGQMYYLGTNAAPAAPVLIRCLKDESDEIASRAAAALGDLAVEPATVVPALTNAAHDPRPLVRRNAIGALGNFRQDARSALPLLLDALTDTNAPVRTAATNALNEIAPDGAGGQWKAGVLE